MPYFWPASTMRPPITVLAMTMNALAPNAVSSSGMYDRGTTPIRNQHTAARPPPSAEERKRVGQDAGERLHVPREGRHDHEGRERLSVEVQLVLQEKLQRQSPDDAGLRDRRDEGPEPDHDVVLAQGETGVGYLRMVSRFQGHLPCVVIAGTTRRPRKVRARRAMFP